MRQSGTENCGIECKRADVCTQQHLLLKVHRLCFCCRMRKYRLRRVLCAKRAPKLEDDLPLSFASQDFVVKCGDVAVTWRGGADTTYRNVRQN